jgi:ferredoxin-type protein NapH
LTIEYLGELLEVTVLAGLTIAGILTILGWKKGLATKVSYLRFFIQVISEIAIFMLISYSLWLGIVLAVLLTMTMFVGRVFCGWICPLGFYMDLATLLRTSFKKHYISLPEQLNVNLHRLRYVILFLLLILPVLSVGTAITQLWPFAILLLGPFNPPRILLAPMVPVITPWKALYGLNINFPYVDQIIYYSSPNFVLVTVLLFVSLMMISSFIIRRFSCRFCPTGSSIGIVNRLKGLKWIPLLHLSKDEGKCTKCGICKRVCPVQVTEVYEQKGGKITTSMCMLCLRCVEMCPSEDALKMNIASKTVFSSRNWLGSPKG